MTTTFIKYDEDNVTMFKWVLIATYLDEKDQLYYVPFGPFSRRQAEDLLAKKDFNKPNLRFVAVTLTQLVDGKDLPLKLVKLP